LGAIHVYGDAIQLPLLHPIRQTNLHLIEIPREATADLGDELTIHPASQDH
jgi:hypothetical protein